jgi:hypothetical protein
MNEQFIRKRVITQSLVDESQEKGTEMTFSDVPDQTRTLGRRLGEG